MSMAGPIVRWSMKTVRVKGVLARVCNPLLSVGNVSSKGGAVLMMDDVGCLLTPQKLRIL